MSAEATLLGRYRILRRVGVGGMATVFLAEDERLRRRVAVKRLHADSLEETARRLEREARVGASLNHPNVVTVYDTATDEEGVLIVMEYVEGETLAEALRRGALAPERAVDIVCQVAAALDHAHAAGIVHRDVKPANVLLGRDGRVKLADLGIAHAAQLTRLTSSGTVLGTASYMAPEQLEGRAVGPAVDVYALAAVAYEALCGRRARAGATPVEVAHRVTSEPPPDLRAAWPEAPSAAAATVAQGMARDPSRRQRSAGELARALSTAVERGAGAALQPTTVPMAPPASKADPPQERPSAAPARRPPPRVGDPRTIRRRTLAARVAAAAAVIAVGATAVALLGSGGDDGSSGDQAASGDGPASGGRGSAPEEAGAADGAAPSEGPIEPLFATDGVGDPARGADLNARGKALIDQGAPEAAVPVLLEAVQSFPQGTDDIQYAYALFNLGDALVQSGRPEEAIPILERRLQIPDQRDVVRAKLREARAAAGG